MGGRSGQSVNSGSVGSGKGKSGQLKEIQKLQQKVKELERRKKEADDALKKSSENLSSEQAIQEFLQKGAEKLKADDALKKAKEELENEQQKTKGTTGNDFTSSDIKNGQFEGQLNPNAQTNYQISKSDMDKLSDKNAQPDKVNGMQKSKYWFTTDQWQNSSDTNKAFADTGLPKTTENMAVLYYTADSKVNTGYYDGQTPTEQDKVYKEILNKSLDKYGNKFDGTTYRGVGGSYADKLWNQVQGNKGGDITFAGFQSSSYDEKGAFGDNTIIVAKSSQGHMLDKFSHYQTEKEVLYKAGSSFKITGYEQKNGKRYIYLED